MKVSLIQMNSINDKAANIAAAEALIERAVAEEAPGLGAAAGTIRLGGRLAGPRSSPTPRRLPGGPAYAMARGQAIKHRIFVHAGSIMERIDGEDRYPQHVGRLQSRGRGDRPLPQDPPLRRDDAGRHRL